MNRFALLTTAALVSLGLAACGAPQAEESDAAASGEQELSETEAQVNDILEAMADTAEASEEERIVAEARRCTAEGDAGEYDLPERGEDQALADFNAAVGEAYLAQNAQSACVFTLPSGLQFRVDRARDGASPDPRGELVEVNYEGTLINGEVFDSSYARGQSATFPSNRLIRGWVEALPLMNVGEEWTLFIPSDLAYGPTGTQGGPIGPNETLIFRLELISLPNRPIDEQ
ncbi:FKBP-type peptidyl-prolyl cis-trans isomerase [Oceanicaulis sp. HTCC2633]|uniref:FKBP-type peptidyl-prolyl cis-trans isomerase n=1 Tax=unclassified Oceanicaulis TaxID=2632123 RepID=UPI000066A183|nr:MULTISPECIES: FKBP-type peptidyl-prolyl cis-trans isomerase [unclassified Oceanicaulis]EAP90177.1 FKBP-type peptidyl-prolyl cis-trans isomerase [Oceanicaulis sp. HTCC2633]|tara:strand:- start:2320 stop:3012 length:693 start_codon:yes stop_codon:yes gene_type:complete